MKIFICSNNTQHIGAKVAKYSILKRSDLDTIDVEIIFEENYSEIQKFFSKPYLRHGRMETFKKNDMQSFTLLRFHIPKLMNFKDKAIVMDPDIYLVRRGFEYLESLSFDEFSIYARRGLKKNSWGSSLMLLSCNQLKHWSIENIISSLHSGEIDYDDLINLRLENNKIGELDKKWNEFDELNNRTIFLHTTEKRTQPWRVGLKLDSSIPPILKYIPRAPIYKLFGKDLTIGIEHPNNQITQFFMSELAECLAKEIITHEEISIAVDMKHMRSDIFDILEQY
ncbi:hypothetical protein N9M61_02500 [Gammaproteobacteria bacterium]|nr:hypothetical protein [Gammaproteobacteria bacterium]MDA8798909.1 hypothetical protein [Gammaproteobacteria bacterium]MDC0919396.1 hypothetical protein [Gammaproteobacteria bacterium]